jgi:protein TonB
MAIQVDREREIRAEGRLVGVFLEEEDRTPLKIAVIIALVFHTLLLGVVFPKWDVKLDKGAQKVVYVLNPYTPPPKTERKRQIQPVEQVKRVPLPDPTPEEPEPIREPEPPDEIELPDIPEDALVLHGIPEGPPAPLAQRVGVAGITEPKRIRTVDPEYPVLARSAGLQGEVILDITIGETGDVSQIQILKALPMGLTEAAVNAVKQWKYEPSTQYGRPVPVIMTIRVQFQLE